MWSVGCQSSLDFIRIPNEVLLRDILDFWPCANWPMKLISDIMPSSLQTTMPNQIYLSSLVENLKPQANLVTSSPESSVILAMQDPLFKVIRNSNTASIKP